MTETNENAFFATQINSQGKQNQQTIVVELEKSIPKQQQTVNQKQQHQTDHKQPQQNPQVDLKTLLELFNSYDTYQKGLITLQEAIQIINSFQHIPKSHHEKIDVYFKLTLTSNQNMLTFDEFLFVFGLTEFDIGSKSIDQQYNYCKFADPRIIDFLRLLNSYRKKCQKQSVYQQAKKSKTKVQQVRQKQYKRRKNYLSIIHQKQLQQLENQQKEKFAQFCQTWDQFMNEYEKTAAQLVKTLNQRQQQAMQEFIQKTKQQLASKIRFSKKVVELQDLQKRLVKSQQYEKADKIKLQIQQLKVFEIQKKQKEDSSVIQLRAQTLRKQHNAAMNTLLQKIQKDRNDQSKQRTSDSQKLIVKSKALVTEVKHRHTDALKKLYENLNNVTIDENRLNLQQAPREKATSSFSQSSRQRI